jgi:hypothetical protein
VDFELRLLNPKDQFTRIFGIWVDSPPPEGWTIDLARQNTAAFKTFVQDGDSVSGSLNLDDGKHDLYVAISQTESSRLGSWTIEGTFNGVKLPTLSKVDWDTIGKYEVNVVDGEVVSSDGESGKDLTTLNATNKIVAAKDAIIEKAGEIRDIVSENRKESALIAGVSATVAVIASVISMKRRRKF